MKRVIATGVQDFETLRVQNSFYIDKTEFIREWWYGRDAVTLITRPRRFGKTLNLSTLNCFFSNKYAGRSDLFEDLKVWEDEELRKQQGAWPVLYLTFAGVKMTDYITTRRKMNRLISDLYGDYRWLLRTDILSDEDRSYFTKVRDEMPDDVAADAMAKLCSWLERYYGKKVLVFLDEYDTPLQEAYVGGFWQELVGYTRAIFNSTFKTNLSLGRGLMTGITRVSKESIVSDLNNLDVVTTTSDKYATAFGFTEEEVFQALDEQGYGEKDKQDVKTWYDGFTFGSVADIYNPWSVTNYLDKGKLGTYWANTSSNGLVENLLRKGDPRVKTQFEALLRGESITVPIDEQIVFDQLDTRENAIWSLLLASGYLKVLHVDDALRDGVRPWNHYTMTLTNLEVRAMFSDMVLRWFERGAYFNEFVRAMFSGDIKAMNRYMNKVALNTFSYFDAAKTAGESEPERFYHGFVLGLLVDQAGDYMLKSNRESGFGRYDVVLEPKDSSRPAVILEFKVHDPENEEKDLEDTARNALKQIAEKRYDAELLARGIPAKKILKYGIAFRGKECRILSGKDS